MSQTAIPFLMLRGGTSRGPYFRSSDLPQDLDTLASVLVRVLGAGHWLNIDGIGGGNAVTTKVAMLSASDDDWADVDYHFAQVSVEDTTVDFKPTCGNILVGVGPAAIEMGLVPATDPETVVRIHAVNSGARVEAVVQTPGGVVSYDGDMSIAGVPGTAAPVSVNFRDTVGSATGWMLPTGSRIDRFDGIDVTCIDVAMPMVIARADAFGLTGQESVSELEQNTVLFKRMESIRLQAGAAMGLGDVTTSVVPKIGVVAPACNGGTISARYFMPWKPHPTMAVTGAQCLAACVLLPGTITDGLETMSDQHSVTLEHASGQIQVRVDYELDRGNLTLNSAGLVRTARLLAKGEVMVPNAIWNGHNNT